MKTVAALLFLASAAALPAHADEAHHEPKALSQALTSPLSDGEVRKVDRDAKKITIRHGKLENLDMPPMTMVFRVSDPTLLGAVKAGDKVKFRAEDVNGTLVVTKIEPAK